MTGPKFRKPPGYRPAAQTRASGPTQEQTPRLPGFRGGLDYRIL